MPAEQLLKFFLLHEKLYVGIKITFYAKAKKTFSEDKHVNSILIKNLFIGYFKGMFSGRISEA